MRIRIQPDVPHGDISFAFSAYETIIDEKKQDHIPLYYHVHPELELLDHGRFHEISSWW